MGLLSNELGNGFDALLDFAISFSVAMYVWHVDDDDGRDQECQQQQLLTLHDWK